MSGEIYLCAHDDDFAQEQRLRGGLKPVLQRLDLSLWGRRDLEPGTQWKDKMKMHLAHADCFIVLVSADCLADEKMCGVEIQAALYRAQYQGLKIIPILLRPCLFEFTDLVSFPSLPKDGKPITSHANTDQAWADVLRDLIESIAATHRYIA